MTPGVDVHDDAGGYLSVKVQGQREQVMKKFGLRKRIEQQLRVWLGRAYRPAKVDDLGATMFGDGDMVHGLVWLNAYIVTALFTLLALVLTCNLIGRSLSVSV